MPQLIGRLLLVALAVAFALRLSLASAGAEMAHALLWLPAGVGAVAFLRLGWPALIAVALGAWAAHASVGATAWPAQLILAGLDAGEAALAGVLFRRTLPRGVRQMRDLVLLVGAVALPTAAVVAYAQATTLFFSGTLGGTERAAYWLNLVFAHGLGLLLGLAAAEGWGRRPRDARGWERLIGLLAAIGLVVHLAAIGSASWVFAGVLLVVAMTVFDGLLGTALGLVVLALSSIALDARGIGPFDDPLALMSWLTVTGLGMLALALQHSGRVELQENVERLVRERSEVLLREMSRRRELEQELQHSPHHDALTGLPNRVLFLDRLQQAMADARRSRNGLAVCCLDLDGFAEVTETHGRQVSDRLLAEFAQRVSARLRKSDTLARIGGDEFAVLALRAPTPDAAAEVALRILNSLELPLLADSHPTTLSASLGIALFPQHGEDEATLLARADAAMFEVKRRGSGGWALYAGDDVRRADEPPAQSPGQGV